MTNQILREAGKYEEISEKGVKEQDRPDFHLSPRTGWMNDPNGFLFYDGKYHLFYQYHPYDSHWGPMHWGHAAADSACAGWQTDHDRLVLDRFSVEIFLNDGEQVLSATINTDQKADGISFFADGLVNMDVIKYDLL